VPSAPAVIHAAGASVDVLSATFAAATLAAVLAGVVRGFSGFGSALILSPSLSALYGPEIAVPVALLLELVLSGPFVPPAAKLVDRRRTALLCAAAAVMVPVGAYLLSVVDEQALRWAICALVFGAVAILGFGWRYHGRPSSAATAATGALSGLFGGATGMTGPPVIFYELAGSAPIERMRASFIMFFAWVDVIALVSFAVTGTLWNSGIALGASALVPMIAGRRSAQRLLDAGAGVLLLAIAVPILGQR